MYNVIPGGPGDGVPGSPGGPIFKEKEMLSLDILCLCGVFITILHNYIIYRKNIY